MAFWVQTAVASLKVILTLVWSSQLHLFSGMFISIACMISLNTLDTEVECVGSPQVCVDGRMDTLSCLEMSHTCIWSQVYNNYRTDPTYFRQSCSIKCIGE